MGFCLPHKFPKKKEKGTSVKIPKSFAKNATYLIHYKLVFNIKIQNRVKYIITKFHETQ